MFMFSFRYQDMYYFFDPDDDHDDDACHCVLVFRQRQCALPEPCIILNGGLV